MDPTTVDLVAVPSPRPNNSAAPPPPPPPPPSDETAVARQLQHDPAMDMPSPFSPDDSAHSRNPSTIPSVGAVSHPPPPPLPAPATDDTSSSVLPTTSNTNVAPRSRGQLEAAGPGGGNAGGARASGAAGAGPLSSASDLTQGGGRCLLEFRDISYTVTDRTTGKDRQILKDMSGYFAPGSFTAILGPSGAGKTSLLHVLGLKIRNSRVTGEILLNGKPAIDQNLTGHMAFVHQDDILHGASTVYEALSFAADLQLPQSWTRAQKDEKIMSILDELGLRHTRDTYIGYTGKQKSVATLKGGVSGGERKRVSIALELVTNPSLLFLDEPTTGLDSYAARAVVEALSRLSQRNRTVVATIHQPSTEIFRKFDNMMLLANGEIVYFGKAKAVADYFESVDIPFNRSSNPAETAVSLLHEAQKCVMPPADSRALIQEESPPAAASSSSSSSDVVKPKRENDDEERGVTVAAARVEQLVSLYKNSDMYREMAAGPPVRPPPLNSAQNKPVFATGYWYQFWKVFVRSTVHGLREPSLIQARVFGTIMSAILAGLVWLRVPTDQRVLQSLPGGIFFIGSFWLFSTLSLTSHHFPVERGVVMREKGSNYYSIFPYFFAKLAVEIPANIILPLIFIVINYFMVGFDLTAGKFFAQYAIFFLSANTGGALGYVIGTGILDPGLAIALEPVVLIPMVMMSGYYVNSTSVPPFLIWIQYISVLYYAFQGLIVNEFTGRTISPDNLPTGNSATPILTGEGIIKHIYPDGALSVGGSCGCLLALYFGCAGLSMFFLWYHSRKRY